MFNALCLKLGTLSPSLSPRDLMFLKEHPEVWDYCQGYGLERQERIIEGARQLCAQTSKLQVDGGEVSKGQGGAGGTCPATGKVCGRQGYGPYGIHSGCVELNYDQ
jgi:hypothetical protein